MTNVKIRWREVVYTKPVYGRFGEYQVTQGRKILSRHDLESQARSWCKDRGYTVTESNSKISFRAGELK